MFASQILSRILFCFLELGGSLARPPGAGRFEGFGWAWARVLRRGCGPRPFNWSRVRARPCPMHFLSNIRARAHPNPLISSIPAPGGRASGRLSFEKERCVKADRFTCPDLSASQDTASIVRRVVKATSSIKKRGFLYRHGSPSAAYPFGGPWIHEGCFRRAAT